MNIVKWDSWRSKSTMVNKTDDMYRVVVDMTHREFFAFSEWAARRETKEEPDNSHQHPHAGFAQMPNSAIVPCPTCGAACRIYSGDEGTNSFEPLTPYRSQRQ